MSVHRYLSSNSRIIYGHSRLLLRLCAALTCLLMGAALTSQAADSAAKLKQSVGKSQTSSGRYRLVEGKGYTVCEQFLKNLNAFPATEPPMVCEAKVHPTHPEFSTPKWEEMDIQSNLKLIYAAESQLWRFTKVGTKPLPYEEWLVKFQQRLESGELKPRLSKTVLALNQLGPETLISYEPVVGECVRDLKRSGVGRYIFVLRDQADVQLQVISSLSPSQSEIILYKGKPYFRSSESSTEQTSEGLKRIWWLPLDRISDNQTDGGAYLRRNQCSYHVDRVSNP